MAASASGLGMGTALPSGAPPVFAETNPARLDDAVEGGAIDHQIPEHGEGARPPGLDRDGVAILEFSHVKLAGGRSVKTPVRFAVDDERAHAADTFTAIVIESDGFLALLDETLVRHVEHFQERHVRDDAAHLIGLDTARRLSVLLPPNPEGEVHYL